jgi:hypothetical protein
MGLDMRDEIKTYYCKKVKRQIAAERIDESGLIMVCCKYYNSNPIKKYSCDIKGRCLVKLAVQREAGK